MQNIEKLPCLCFVLLDILYKRLKSCVLYWRCGHVCRPHADTWPPVQHETTVSVFLGFTIPVCESTQAEMGHQPRSRLLITPVILGKLGLVWERTQHDHNSLMLWAVCTTYFFSFLRLGEITAPTTPSFDATYHLTNVL